MTPLIEHTLFGTIDKVAKAIDRLRHFEPDEGYYLAFSGGKDSVVIKALADMAEIKYDAHYAVSGIDPPELVRFIKAVHPDVQWDRHAPPFFIQMVESGCPTRLMRWCCKKYKEAGGSGRMVLTGIRWAESASRNKRMMTERCYNDPTRTFLHAIIDWSDQDVWDFIREHDIDYCRLYDTGWKRLGCICCPFKSTADRQRELDQWPAFEKAFRHAFRKLHANRKAAGNPSVDRWADGDEMFEWWIQHDPPAQDDPDQGALFA